MFTVSAKGIYGLTAMIELGTRYGQRPVQIRDIAGPNRIPQHYLEQILVAMKKAGLVESFRGVQGGYALASHPAKITVLEILTSLEGRLEIVSDQKRGGPLEFFWSRLEREISSLLDLSLEELISRRERAGHNFTYII